MKNSLLRLFTGIIFILLVIQPCFSQTLDGYKYVYLPPLKYSDGGVDNWGLRQDVYRCLNDKGLIIVSSIDQLPSATSRDYYCSLFCLIQHSWEENALSYTHTITITMTNWLSEKVCVIRESASAISSKSAYKKAYKKVLECIKKIDYQFDATKTPQEALPEVEKTTWDEQKIRQYLDTCSSLSEIEGVYKSVASKYTGYYKLGVVRDGAYYKAIILETDNYRWEKGEVKAIFEKANMSLYSVKFFMGLKKKVETFATYEPEGVLNIDLNNGEITSFVKLYPINQSAPPKRNVQKPSDSWKASGTGFFVSGDGYIATNAHVIAGHNRITVEMLKNERVVRFEAVEIVSDPINDVAIIKVDDEKFVPFNSLPYTIETNVNIGADVYTIGFPLNDVMGTNYKVTNGIISAKTGIDDDIRKYQITVPIQPGNSGGPLINKNGNIVGITTSSLNGNAVGTKVENVNYAVKSLYLLNAINMVPQIDELPTKSTIANKSMEEQIVVLKDYICLIRIY